MQSIFRNIYKNTILLDSKEFKHILLVFHKIIIK